MQIRWEAEEECQPLEMEAGTCSPGAASVTSSLPWPALVALGHSEGARRAGVESVVPPLTGVEGCWLHSSSCPCPFFKHKVGLQNSFPSQNFQGYCGLEPTTTTESEIGTKGRLFSQ